MKPRRRLRWLAAAWLGLAVTLSALSAAETNAPALSAPVPPPALATNAAPVSESPAAPAPETTTNAPPVVAPVSKPLTPEQFFEGGITPYNNWIEFAAGGFITSGDTAQFRQQRQSTGDPFGGISDLHYQLNLDKTTILTTDARALFDEHDYKLNLAVTREKLGFVRLSYTEFRTWYNGDGGYYPPTAAWYPLPGDGLGLDRGEILFEAGLRMEKVPNITFKYAHNFREGDKSSTIWGYTHPAGGTLVRGLSPTVRQIDEQADTFQLDVDHRIKSTAFGVGLRYESGKLNDALKITQFPGEAVQQKVTDRQETTFDMFNVHAFTETWFSKNILFSSGYSYTDVDNNFTGSRIYGADFDVPYAPDPQSGFGYSDMRGNSRLRENVMNLNLLARVSKNLSITPSLRAQGRNLDSGFTGTETLADNAPTPFNGDSFRDDLELRERLDVSYTGITNWVFNLRGEWIEGQGNLTENGGLVPVNGVGVPAIQRQTDDSRFFQKYGLNTRWYPIRRVTVNAGGYYKLSDYDYDHSVDSTTNNSANRYPAYLVAQNIGTWDGNIGLTLRLGRNVTLFSRYEFQASTIYTTPDPISGLSEAQSSEMTSHLIAQNVSWAPWSRLNLGVGFNYVLSETKTPGLPKSLNDYWTMNFFSGFVLDDKTDLNLNFFYYRADDYADNSAVTVPYGAGAEEYAITVGIVRRLTKQLRLNLTYGYYQYRDEPSGGHEDYEAHRVSSSLQYRF